MLKRVSLTEAVLLLVGFHVFYCVTRIRQIKTICI